jgi:hypothetical protein
MTLAALTERIASGALWAWLAFAVSEGVALHAPMMTILPGNMVSSESLAVYGFIAKGGQPGAGRHWLFAARHLLYDMPNRCAKSCSS